MPGPGHPGHFPRPWTTGGPVPPGGAPGGSQSSSAGSEPAGAAPEQPAKDGEPGPGPSGARAAEAAARVADLLAEDGDEEESAPPPPAGKERAATPGGPGAGAGDSAELAKVEAARDEYLDRLQRLQADFANYKKRVQRQQVEDRERAAEDLIVKLLPVLDNFDLAMAHHDDGLEPVYRTLMGVLETAGVERLDPVGQPFDPNEHDAVQHEEGEGAEVPEVIEVLRAGYRWKGRVLRPAMVKVKG